MSSNRTNNKMIHGGCLVVLVIALAGCGGGGPASAPSTAPQPVASAPVAQVSAGTWVVMGSSTATGAGAPAGKGWVDLLQASMASHGAQFVNIAVGGSVTYHGLSASTPSVPGRPSPNPAVNIDQALARKPVALIVAYPTNDTALGYSTQETVSNILSIRAKALAAGVPVVITSTQPRNMNNEMLARLKEIDQQLLANVQGCFVDVGTALAGQDGRLSGQFDSGDGVHPNEAGHRQIAAKVQQGLESSVCVRLSTSK